MMMHHAAALLCLSALAAALCGADAKRTVSACLRPCHAPLSTCLALQRLDRGNPLKQIIFIYNRRCFFFRLLHMQLLAPGDPAASTAPTNPRVPLLESITPAAPPAQPEYFIEIRDGQFANGCNNFKIAGWNAW